MDQWFFKITQYAEELLEGLETLDRWPEKVKTMQANWIGKSEGLQMYFQWLDDEASPDYLFGEEGSKDITPKLGHSSIHDWVLEHFPDDVKVYTTRPDTLFGASFIALSPDHPIVQGLAKSNPEIQDFITECAKIGTSEEAIAQAPKLGLDTGLRVIHPLMDIQSPTEEYTLPVWIANFVLMGYGTGAIFGCPAHDQRDLDFARKYNLPVKPVILPDGETPDSFKIENEAYAGDGILYNSNHYLDGLRKEEGIKTAISEIEKRRYGKGTTQYRLRDWGVSRQRYWGCPIPVIHCGDCGVVPVPEADLPVALSLIHI